ncbi:MAG: caspase family protein, partial [Caldilineaceae bacterium]|nr:caspase family protein [Caldilineaceae bacterium]
MTTHHALLIGVDHYFEYRLPNGLYYPRLGGCVRDINKVYSFLTTRIGVDPANIIKLTATYGGELPHEPESEWPTYRNMVNAFQTLTNRVQPDDQVYIQYSGHGGRVTTMLPELKGQNGFDEGLVPLDIGKPNDPDARYLRDFEMHNLIQALVDKGVRLTVVFDCCHSGGATRDIGGARKRGIGQPDRSAPPTDSAVGDLA